MDIFANNALRYISFAVLAALGAAVLSLAFVGWQRFSAEIFLSAVESGLAWCL